MIVSDVDTPVTATATKRQLVEHAFNECRLNGWEYDITAEEKDRALSRLDALMRELLGRGYDLAYNFPTAIGAGDLDDQLGCPDGAFYGLGTLLAFRLAPTMGKTISAESRVAMQDAMKAVIASAIDPIPTASFAPGTPMGSGNKSYYPFNTTA